MSTSEPRKPRLDTVILAESSVANLVIMYRLLGERKKEAFNILDYLLYTTKMCQLVQKFNLMSVLMFDREYRKLQTTHEFRWGTNISHFHSVNLKTRPVKQSGMYNGKGHLGTGVVTTSHNTRGPDHRGKSHLQNV